MKKLMWAAVALTLFAMTSRAQNTPKADFGVGYAFVHVSQSGTSANLNGFNASIAYNVTDVIGIVGDIGYYHGSPSGVSLNDTSYAFGPRFSFRKSDKATPFVQALFGGSHLSASFGGASGSTNPFLYSFGGGVDVPMKGGKIAFRPEFDYVGQRVNGTTLNGVRIGAGIVFNIGQK
ncbi:MAG TPA: outer membrane beta-barrel protein [Candidatus Acidoferrales bacterium]|nr:outer membrane beta-barrel protein [Candidatus Acidoferrales bacterium]